MGLGCGQTWLFRNYPMFGEDGEIFLDSEYKQLLGPSSPVRATSTLHVKEGFIVHIKRVGDRACGLGY